MNTLNIDMQGVHLLCDNFNAHNPAWDTIVKHDNIGNYIAMVIHNNMIANDACTSTFLYSRQRNNEQSTHVKGYCSPDITLYKDCTIKKWKIID